MSEDQNPHKSALTRLMPELRKKAGFSNPQAFCTALNLEGIEEITRGSYLSRYEQQASKNSSYDVEEVIAIIKVLSTSRKQACTAYEALQILEHTGWLLSEDDKYSKPVEAIRQFFDEEKFHQAIHRKSKDLSNQYAARIDKNHPLAKYIHDFGSEIARLTENFQGRKWLFERIDNFIETRPNGYFFIIGDPGIGKSALAAYYTKMRDCIHYFNIFAEGNATTDACMRHICASLITRYELEIELPNQAIDNSNLIRDIFSALSKEDKLKKPCVIVIDALDEALEQEPERRGNPLALPSSLPDKIFIIITSRPPQKRDTKMRITGEQDREEILAKSPNNQSDILDYLASRITHVQSYLRHHELEPQVFIKKMARQSDYNFMYLHYILKDLAQNNSSSYHDRAPETLPLGLNDYYDEHWRRMKGLNEKAWFDYKLNVLVALTTAYGAATSKTLARLSGRKQIQVQQVLDEWNAFIHRFVNRIQEKDYEFYRWYHHSFNSFLKKKARIDSENINLSSLKEDQADNLMDFWYEGREQDLTGLDDFLNEEYYGGTDNDQLDDEDEDENGIDDSRDED